MPACSDRPAGNIAVGASGGSGAGRIGSGGRSGTSEAAWPTSDPITLVDDADEFTGNLSGLAFEAGADGARDVLWGVRNAPSLLYRLSWDGEVWTSVTDAPWPGGRKLRFPDGTGDPDAEGVTRADGTSSAIYLSVERDDVTTLRRFSVLRFDTDAAARTLVATHEWNLTADLPTVDSNLGLEGITWVPDTFLVDHAFFDEHTGMRYDPDLYAGHGSGLFFVGLEANGMIYAYALDHASGGFTRVATIGSGQDAVVELTFDRDAGALWAYCDVTCHNQAAVLTIDATTGRFTERWLFDAPAALPDANNEGFAIAPGATCRDGVKRAWWSDDSDTGGHSLRQGTVPCQPL
ncbi:MAG TPA: hypothetical protein VHU40_23005 [Polyangia bacterium]|nr:hypothetical protein [Polyangia bacterium]